MKRLGCELVSRIAHAHLGLGRGDRLVCGRLGANTRGLKAWIVSGRCGLNNLKRNKWACRMWTGGLAVISVDSSLGACHHLGLRDGAGERGSKAEFGV